MFSARHFLLSATVVLCFGANAIDVVPVHFSGPDASQVIGRYMYLLDEAVSVTIPGRPWMRVSGPDRTRMFEPGNFGQHTVDAFRPP